MAFGFLGDIVENIGDVILPRGTRGSTIGGAIGGAVGGPGGAAIGSALGAATSSAISSGQQGAEAVSSPTVAQAPALAPESSVSGSGPSVYRPSFTDYEGRVPLTAGIGTAVGTVLRNPAVTGTIGAVGGSVLDITYGLMGGCGKTMPKLVGMTKDGCPTVTRKQQRVLRQMAMYMPLESVAYEAGVDTTTMARLISKSFPPRAKGISGAQLRNAKRVNNQILNMAGKLGYNVTPKTKAQLGCK